MKNIITKKNYVGKYCSNSQCLKKKNYKAKLLTSSILKKTKIDEDNFVKKQLKKRKKQKKKIGEKNKTKK